MFKQIKYFQAVVRTGSFTKAAGECYISQSAISQQIKALEQTLGFALLKRTKRSFTLTSAGEFFYKKSLILVADFDAICKEAAYIAGNKEQELKIGILRGYSGNEFQTAVSEFSSQFADASVAILHGNHDELYDLLRKNEIDIAFNDQRRAFSDEYLNIILSEQEYYIEISSKNPIAELTSVSVSDLKNVSCILLASDEQRGTEQNFYNNDIGFQSELIFTNSIEDARMLLIQGKGFMPVEGAEKYVQLENVTKRLKLTRSGKPIIRKYCAFMKHDNKSTYTGEFLEILNNEFKRGMIL